MKLLILKILLKSMGGWTILWRSKPWLFVTLINCIAAGTWGLAMEVTGVNDHFRSQEKEIKRLNKETDEILINMCKEASEQEKRKIEKGLDAILDDFKSRQDESLIDFEKWCKEHLNIQED